MAYLITFRELFTMKASLNCNKQTNISDLSNSLSVSKCTSLYPRTKHRKLLALTTTQHRTVLSAYETWQHWNLHKPHVATLRYYGMCSQQMPPYDQNQFESGVSQTWTEERDMALAVDIARCELINLLCPCYKIVPVCR